MRIELALMCTDSMNQKIYTESLGLCTLYSLYYGTVFQLSTLYRAFRSALNERVWKCLQRAVNLQVVSRLRGDKM